MSERVDVGPLEVICDAPSYPVVKACGDMYEGPLLETPLDVPWYQWPENVPVNAEIVCMCLEEKLPRLRRFRFFLANGDEEVYGITQCPRCKKVFWKEVERA